MKEIAESMKNQHQELQIENLAQSALDAEFQKTLDEYNARHPLVPAKDAKTETGTDGVAVAPVDTPADDAEVDIPSKPFQYNRWCTGPQNMPTNLVFSDRG
jgi:hypothetical protein